MTVIVTKIKFSSQEASNRLSQENPEAGNITWWKQFSGYYTTVIWLVKENLT